MCMSSIRATRDRSDEVPMRLAMILTLATLLCSPPASSQGLSPNGRPFGLDPYNPTDAALLSNYGGVLVDQMPLLEVSRLDPFNPTEAALLRSFGGGIPVWGGWGPWYPYPP